MSELYMNLGQSISPEIMDIVQKMQGPPIAPAQQSQLQQAEAPNPEPVSQKVAATRITPDDLARDIIGRSAEQYSNLLNNTSDDVYQSAYQIARQSGSTMDEARQFAREKASFHQNQRVNALSQAFLHGGLDADGTITRQGVGILAQLAQENPQQVNMLGNMFQSPQDATKYAQDIAKMMTSSDLNLRNSKEMAGFNFDLQQRGADAQMQRQMALRQWEANLNMDQKMALMQAEPEVRFNIAKRFGMSDQDAVAYAIGGGGGGGRSGGRNGAGQASSKEISDARKDIEARLKMNKTRIEEMQESGADYANDPEYKRLVDERKNLYKEYDNIGKEDPEINVDDETQFIPQYMKAKGVSADEAMKAWERLHPEKFSGYGELNKILSSMQKESGGGNAHTNEELRNIAQDGSFLKWLNEGGTSKPLFGEISDERREEVIRDFLNWVATKWQNFTDPSAAERAYKAKSEKWEAAKNRMSLNR